MSHLTFDYLHDVIRCDGCWLVLRIPWMDGWMDVHFGSWALTLSKECSLASYPSTESVDNASGRVIPAKKQSIFSQNCCPPTDRLTGKA